MLRPTRSLQTPPYLGRGAEPVRGLPEHVYVGGRRANPGMWGCHGLSHPGVMGKPSRRNSWARGARSAKKRCELHAHGCFAEAALFGCREAVNGAESPCSLRHCGHHGGMHCSVDPQRSGDVRTEDSSTTLTAMFLVTFLPARNPGGFLVRLLLASFRSPLAVDRRIPH